MVARANQYHPLWYVEHFANGEHNSEKVPLTAIIVNSAGSVVAQSSIKDAGASYSATASKLSTGRYLVTFDSAITALTAHATAYYTGTGAQAQVDAISTNTVQVRTYAVSAAGAFTLTDMEFFLTMSAAKFQVDPVTSLTTAFAPGDFPAASKVLEIVDAQNATWDDSQVRHTSGGVHDDARIPDALARIKYSGGAYSIYNGSTGISSVSRPATGKCTINFTHTATTQWSVRVTPIGVAVYWYISARSTSAVTVELFNTATKPTYALGDTSFFVAGWKL